MVGSPGLLRENMQSVRERVARAAQASGRDPGSVAIMAVTKTHPADTVRAALRAGFELFGENRIQEAEAKYGPLREASVEAKAAAEASREPAPDGGPDVGRFALHLIGHLQRNKARAAAGLFECVQSIDKYETAEVLNRHCSEGGKTIDVLLELNTSGEESKFGCESETELRRVMDRILGLENLRIRGLMTVGPFTEDAGRIRAAFARLRELFARLRDEHRELRFDVLSMGMSGDFEIAVEEGATMIRLGTVLFGPRTQ